ncbi:MAG: UbiA-like polyprenyltransferase [Thermodesulfobacteriota bacterium]
MLTASLGTARSLLSLVKIEHTLFALPLALTGTILAQRGLPGLRVLVLVILAFAGARAAAMGFNRLVDRHLDAANPRTAGREIPTGKVGLAQAWVLVTGACVVYFLAAWALNELCFALSPFALAVLLGYSYTKRFTMLCHVFLGISLGMAPIAGWIAVTGGFSWIPVILALGVVFWVAGFDVIYACQDVAFDRQEGLHSIPARFGSAKALRFAAAAHFAAFSLFVAAGASANLAWPFYVLIAVTGGLLYWEHRLVSPTDLSRLDLAFFKVNSMISGSLLAAVWFGLP